jgi:CHAT domain-containing protein/Tfp pilus assembly protein PilF
LKIQSAASKMIPSAYYSRNTPSTSIGKCEKSAKVAQPVMATLYALESLHAERIRVGIQGCAQRPLIALAALLIAASLLLSNSRPAFGALEEAWEDSINTGIAAAKRQDLNAAARAFEKAVRDGQYIDSDRHVVSLNFLGEIYLRLGDFSKGEHVLRRAMQIVDNIPGIADLDRASTTNNLAAILDAQGHVRQAEMLYERALELLLRTEHSRSVDIFPVISNLAGLHERLGNRRLAEWLYRLVVGDSGSQKLDKEAAIGAAQLRLRKQVRGTAPVETHITALNNLGTLLANENRLEEAEYFLSLAQSLAASSEALMLESASSAHNRGLVLDRLGRADAARSTLEHAYSLRLKMLGNRHPDVASTRYAIAQHFAVRDDVTTAMEHARSALAVIEPRITSESSLGGLGASSRIAMARQWRDAFEAHLAILQRFRDKAGHAWKEEAFRLIQLAKLSETAMAIAGTAQRHSVVDPATADTLRKRQDAVLQRQDAEQKLMALLALPPPERERGALASVRAELDRVDRTLAEIARISQGALNDSATATLKATQLALRPGEALLIFLLGSQSSHLAAITAETSNFVVLDAPRFDVIEAVRRLRNHFHIAATGGSSAFPVDDAHRLYLQLLAPAELYLHGSRELIIVADSELETLPFSILLKQAVKTSNSPGAMRGYPWVIRNFAFTSLPSADALVKLRSAPRGSPHRDSFIAFADPRFEQPGSIPSRGGVRFSSAFAKSEDLRGIAPLPESADEVAAIAKLLGAPASSLYLGDRASETQVKSIPLERFRVVMFATHGVQSGEIPGILEPALILSLPAKSSTQDDGVLTASEIGRLKLDADWVILSACNTAASDGTPGNEGFSGLARAFFHAGARALLVSHWPVASEPTVLLTTRMFQALGKEERMSRAQALQQSILEMIDSSARPELSQPFFWAPFVLVGNSTQ